MEWKKKKFQESETHKQLFQLEIERAQLCTHE